MRAAYGVAFAAGALAILGAWPALAAVGRSPARAWMWIVLGMSLMELAYALWLAGLPDWSTLWVGRWLALAWSAIYALALLAALAMPVSNALPLGLDEVRSGLALWAATLATLHAVLAAAAGWIAVRWRREYERAKLAARGG